VRRLSVLFRRLLPLAALAAALFVAACGIKGPLELPESEANAGKSSARFVSSPNATLPGYYEPSARDRKAAKQLGRPSKPDEPFVLDPLLN